jgi:hypothetical protein
MVIAIGKLRATAGSEVSVSQARGDVSGHSCGRRRAGVLAIPGRQGSAGRRGEDDQPAATGRRLFRQEER